MFGFAPWLYKIIGMLAYARVFQVLAKLLFAVFLTHPLVMAWMIGEVYDYFPENPTATVIMSLYQTD